MRVWFLKETKSICTDCGSGCNVLIGSRENKMYRYEPRQNDAVNGHWMCDSGRLNYKWIGREDRLNMIKSPKGAIPWPMVLKEISALVPLKEVQLRLWLLQGKLMKSFTFLTTWQSTWMRRLIPYRAVARQIT